VHLRLAEIKRTNAGSLYDADVGALGDALERGGIARGVVANADTLPAPDDPTTYHRQAALALMGSDGQVPCGAVGKELVDVDAGAPFGVTFDVDAALGAFTRCWRDRSVVVVESSDLPRTERYERRVSKARFDELWQAALRRTDQLVERLLAEVDPERDAVLLVSPSASQTRSPRLTVFALRAPGLEPSLLESGVTRQAGFVSIVDVAPTIASLVRAPLAEEEIEGRTVASARRGGDADDRISFLVDADADARFRDRMLTPFVSTFITLVVLVAFAAALSLRLGRRWWLLEPLALGLLAVLPLTYWAALLPFSQWGSAAYVAFTLGGGLVIGVLAHVVSRRLAASLVIVLTLLLGTIAVSVVLLDSRLQLSTVFGDSPIVAGRFSGINNVTFAQLMVATILLGGFICASGARHARWLVLAFFAAVVLIDGAPMWGADVGGLLAGVPALALTFTLLGGWRIRVRTVAVWIVAAVVAVVALGLLDLTRDSADRTHLGRLFERIGHEGWDGFATVVGRKLQVNIATLTSSVWRFLFVPVLVLAGYVVWWSPGRFKTLRERLPVLDPVFVGIGAAALLGYAVNDSGIAVPAVMLAVLALAVVYLLSRVDERPV
jgi:hypothetical protein